MSIDQASISVALALQETTGLNALARRWTAGGGLSEGEYIQGRLVIADEASDQEIDLGTLAMAEVLLLSSDQEVTVKLNGTEQDELTLTQMENGQAALLVLFGATTSVHISNDSGSTANVDFVAAG